MVPGSHRAVWGPDLSWQAAAAELGLRHGGWGAGPRLKEGPQRKKPR